ncbi:MAG TPA: DUF1553 domain-containing protein [Planctomycetota bacterium]|nr:DUF1553 domain-containing protein [Planctomycetota bacterium]
MLPLSLMDSPRPERSCRQRAGLAAFALAAIFLRAAQPAFAAETKPEVSTAQAAAAQTAPAAAPGQAMWVDHIEPILRKSCVKCHGAEKQKGGLDLRAPQSILAGGTDGSVVVAGRPGESPLYQRVQPGNKDHMPPNEEVQLNPEELSLIQQWIATLPEPGHPPIGAGAMLISTQTAPSLIEQLASSKWQPPPGMSPSEVIDFQIESHWKEQKASGTGVCDDRTFVRRIYLDLAGRIPTRTEADAFVKSAEPAKRAKLVESLLNGSDYPRRMAEMLDVVLMERKGKGAESERKSHGWYSFLEHAIAANLPWNEVVGELIVARPKAADDKGAVQFLYERKNNYQLMAEAIAPVAFGVSIGCAQCHNHPLAHEIKQQNYWGLVAAFNRSTNADTPSGPALSESAVGGFVNFTNLKKESQPAVLSLLNDRTIDEKRPAENAKEEDVPGKYIVPPAVFVSADAPPPEPQAKGKRRPNANPKVAAIPKFSRRQAIAESITRDNPLLARAFVNRTWAMLMGRGFVNPVDQMDSRHPPSHPELLAWLSEDFAKSGYDIKHLIRVIVLSRTYQLSAQVDGAAPSAPELFARGLEKPLSAEVLYRSLLVATVHDSEGGDAADFEPLRNGLITAFPTLFDLEYNATLQQATFLTNNPAVDNLLKPAGQDLTARLLTLSSNEEKAREMFAQILGRSPDKDELSGLVAYLDARKSRPEAAVRQVAWALLTTPEFLMNH